MENGFRRLVDVVRAIQKGLGGTSINARKHNSKYKNKL